MLNGFEKCTPFTSDYRAVIPLSPSPSLSLLLFHAKKLEVEIQTTHTQKVNDFILNKFLNRRISRRRDEKICGMTCHTIKAET